MSKVMNLGIDPALGEKEMVDCSQFTHMILCPACKCGHGISVKPGRWSFNGDHERPTFSPSLLVRGYSEHAGRDFVCHSFIRDGRIEFLADSTHELAGRTVDLPDFND